MQEVNLKKMLALRHRLHMFPELSMREKGTLGIIQQFLRQNTGLCVTDRGGWCFAVKEGQPGGRKLAFRADMDALPIAEGDALPYHSRNAGVSHRCGHDGHSAALCGFAMELDRRDIEDTVYLIFQPGEETGEGALLCRQLIAQENISEIFAFHNLSGYPEKQVVYRKGLTQPASEGIRIWFKGKTSHASAPEEGGNPAEIISKIVLFAGKQTEGGQAGMVLCTVTGIRLGDGNFGISPGEGELSLTLRAERESVMKKLENDILLYTEKICSRAGIPAGWSIHDYFPETRNSGESLARVLEAAAAAGLETKEMAQMWRASEDFGWYLKECPGAMIYIGNGRDYPALHTEEYDFNDAVLESAVELFLNLVE